MKYGSEKRSHLRFSVGCLTASTGNKHFQAANIPHPRLSPSHSSLVYKKTWSDWPIDWPTMSVPVIMAIESGQGGRVLAWPHLHRPNLHMQILNYNSHNTNCVTLEMLPKASLYLDLRYVQAISVHSVAISSTKPKTWHVAYRWPTRVVWLWHVHAAKFKHGISMWIRI